MVENDPRTIPASVDDVATALTRAYAPQDAAARADAEARVAAEWNAGDIILDLYEVKGLLGEGGMGKVYRVHHRGWAVDLAVKSPRPEVFAAAGGKENFVREAEAWSDLGLHPHIVSCYYVRTLGDVPRVFAECVEGGSLEEWIRSRKLYEGGQDKALERILDVAIQFAWGLEYAHELGLVHQDVKPHNVMLTDDGAAKVTDFGLARAGSLAGGVSAAPGGTLMVSSGGLTPAYASPEQVAGESLTRRTDVWSWAVSVLEMFNGDVTWALGPAAPQALAGYLGSTSGDDALPRMPQAVAEILQHCFARARDERPRTMSDVANRLIGVYRDACAESYGRLAPEAAPDTAQSLNNRACSRYDLGAREEAEALWEQALGLHPGHLESTYNRGLVQWRSGRGDDMGLLGELRGAEAEDWRNLYAQALVHLERGDATGALDALERVPEGERDTPEMRVSTAEARRRRSGGPVRTFEAHRHGVDCVDVSGDGRHALSGGFRDLKLWEIATGQCLRTIEGERTVRSVRLSIDGRHALSGGRDNTLSLWDVATGRCLLTFEGHTDSVNSVELTADGLNAVSASCDNTLKLWDVTTGRCLWTFNGHTDSVQSVRLSADGQRALSGSSDETLRLWHVGTGRCLQAFEGHTGSVTSVDLSADGRHALSGSWDKTLKLWDIATGRCLRTFEGHDLRVTSVHVSADGRHALSGSQDRTVKLWQVPTGRCLRTFEGHTEEVTAVKLNADGRSALSGSDDKTLTLWETGPCLEASPSPLLLTRLVTSEEALRLRRAYEAEIATARAALSSEDVEAGARAARRVRTARALAGYRYGKEAIEIWEALHDRFPRGELQGAAALRTLEGHDSAVNSVHLSADGHHAVSGSRDHTVKLWDLETGRCVRTLEGHAEPVSSVRFSVDGRHALSGSLDTTLKLWDLTTGNCLRTFEGHGDWISSVRLTADGRHGLSASRDTTLKLWDMATGRCLRTLEGHTEAVTSGDLTADGRQALSGSWDKTLRLWDTATGHCLRTIQGHSDGVNCAEISADGHHAFSGSYLTMRQWEAHTGLQARFFVGHTDQVVAVHVSADSSYALSGSRDKTLRLWEVATGDCLRTLEGHTGSVNAVCMSANGHHAVSGSDDSTLRLWYLDWELLELDLRDAARVPAPAPTPRAKRSFLHALRRLLGR